MRRNGIRNTARIVPLKWCTEEESAIGLHDCANAHSTEAPIRCISSDTKSICAAVREQQQTSPQTPLPRRGQHECTMFEG